MLHSQFRKFQVTNPRLLDNRLQFAVQTGVISGFLRELDEKYAVLGYYAASDGNFLPTFRDNLSVSFSVFDDGTDWLSRNVGKKLPSLSA